MEGGGDAQHALPQQTPEVARFTAISSAEVPKIRDSGSPPPNPLDLLRKERENPNIFLEREAQRLQMEEVTQEGWGWEVTSESNLVTGLGISSESVFVELDFVFFAIVLVVLCPICQISTSPSRIWLYFSNK